MLAYSRPDRLELLPAVTAETAGGRLSGMGLRSGGTLDMGVERRKGAVVPHRARTGYGTGNLCKWKNGRSEAAGRGGILRKIKQDKIFWYYLLTYLAVLFIPMVICCFYYIYMLSLIAEDDIRGKRERAFPCRCAGGQCAGRVRVSGRLYRC